MTGNYPPNLHLTCCVSYHERLSGKVFLWFHLILKGEGAIWKDYKAGIVWELFQMYLRSQLWLYKYFLLVSSYVYSGLFNTSICLFFLQVYNAGPSTLPGAFLDISFPNRLSATGAEIFHVQQMMVSTLPCIQLLREVVKCLQVLLNTTCRFLVTAGEYAQVMVVIVLKSSVL